MRSEEIAKAMPTTSAPARASATAAGTTDSSRDTGDDGDLAVQTKRSV